MLAIGEHVDRRARTRERDRLPDHGNQHEEDDGATTHGPHSIEPAAARGPRLSRAARPPCRLPQHGEDGRHRWEAMRGKGRGSGGPRWLRGCIDNALRQLLGRSHGPEMRQQQQVVDDLDRAGDQQRPAERGGPEQQAGEGRADRRGEAARHRRDARRRRPLGGRRRSPSRRNCASARPSATARCARTGARSTSRGSGMNGIATRHRLDGRCVNTIVLTSPKRVAMRTATRYEHRGQDAGPEEQRAGGGERQRERLVQPQREHRLHDEAAAEGVEAEERRERVDVLPGGRQRRSLRVRAGERGAAASR